MRVLAIYIYIYIYIYPLIYTPLPYSTCLHSKVRSKGTTWCIHVAQGTKLDENGLKMGSKHFFVHPQWSKIAFGKTRFGPISPIFAPKTAPFQGIFGFPWAKTGPNGLKMG